MGEALRETLVPNEVHSATIYLRLSIKGTKYKEEIEKHGGHITYNQQ